MEGILKSFKPYTKEAQAKFDECKEKYGHEFFEDAKAWEELQAAEDAWREKNPEEAWLQDFQMLNDHCVSVLSSLLHPDEELSESEDYAWKEVNSAFGLLLKWIERGHNEVLELKARLKDFEKQVRPETKDRRTEIEGLIKQNPTLSYKPFLALIEKQEMFITKPTFYNWKRSLMRKTMDKKASK